MWTTRALVTPLGALTLFSATLLPASSQIAAAAGPAAVTVSSTVRLHPLLQYGARADPLRVTRVIVQKQRKDAHASDLAARIPGGVVVEEFSVVPAFVLDAPQGLLPVLAASADVHYISPDGPVEVVQQLPLDNRKSNANHPNAPAARDEHHIKVSSDNLTTTYPFAVGAPSAWSGAASWDRKTLTGANTTVAIVDSGVDVDHPDLVGRVVAVNVNRSATSPRDGYGHGTHVAGVIGGQSASGDYLGIAPNTTIVSVKVTDDQGAAFESDLLRGLDWLNLYRDQYHIRVANLSVTTSLPESYATSPIDAAVEALYHQNVTVVAAAGNLGSARDAVWYAPGNDPLAITVGCLDDNATPVGSDDSLCPISSRGVTEDGFPKPDVVAPGRKILSALASGVNGHDSVLGTEFQNRISTDGRHIRLSGTSMSAPVVAGAIALLLERQPGLAPDQIREILVSTARTYGGEADRAGVLNIPAAIAATQHPPAHRPYGPLPIDGTPPPNGSHWLVWDGSNWGTVFWSSAHWDTAHWDAAHWDAAHWDTAHWDATYWDSAHWDSAHWDSAHWDSAHWDSAHWDAAHWDGAHWDSAAQYD